MIRFLLSFILIRSKLEIINSDFDFEFGKSTILIEILTYLVIKYC